MSDQKHGRDNVDHRHHHGLAPNELRQDDANDRAQDHDDAQAVVLAIVIAREEDRVGHHHEGADREVLVEDHRSRAGADQEQGEQNRGSFAHDSLQERYRLHRRGVSRSRIGRSARFGTYRFLNGMLI